MKFHATPILIILLILIIFTYSTVKIPKHRIDRAEKGCKDRGGMTFYDVGILMVDEVVCGNGETIYIHNIPK